MQLNRIASIGTSVRRGTAAAPMLIAAALATAQPVPSSILACRAETDGPRRLACYDREIARAVDARGAEEEAGETKQPAQPAPERPENNYRDPGAPARVRAVVAAVLRLPHGWIALQLRNGQLWEQTEDGPDLGIKPGDMVTIDRGALGARWLWLRTDRLAIKVRRLR